MDTGYQNTDVRIDQANKRINSINIQLQEERAGLWRLEQLRERQYQNSMIVEQKLFLDMSKGQPQ